MGPRRLSREFALQIMFQREFSPHLSAREILTTYAESFNVDPEISDYGLQLIVGVEQNKEAIDQAIQSVSRNWKITRMALVDLNISRMAVYETFHMSPPLPKGVAINEAVELAKKYGSTDSASFVNGVLDQLAKSKEA